MLPTSLEQAQTVEALRRDVPRNYWFALRVFHAGCAVSYVLCAAVALVLARTSDLPGLMGRNEEMREALRRLPPIVAAAVALILVALPLLSRWIWSRQAPAPIDPGAPDPKTLERSLAAYMTSTLLVLAAAETPGVLGLIVFILTGSWPWFAALALPGLIAALALYPSPERLAAKLAQDTRSA